jgi:hypothetical protein
VKNSAPSLVEPIFNREAGVQTARRRQCAGFSEGFAAIEAEFVFQMSRCAGKCRRVDS